MQFVEFNNLSVILLKVAIEDAEIILLADNKFTWSIHKIIL